MKATSSPVLFIHTMGMVKRSEPSDKQQTDSRSERTSPLPESSRSYSQPTTPGPWPQSRPCSPCHCSSGNHSEPVSTYPAQQLDQRGSISARHLRALLPLDRHYGPSQPAYNVNFANNLAPTMRSTRRTRNRAT